MMYDACEMELDIDQCKEAMFIYEKAHADFSEVCCRLAFICNLGVLTTAPVTTVMATRAAHQENRRAAKIRRWRYWLDILERVNHAKLSVKPKHCNEARKS